MFIKKKYIYKGIKDNKIITGESNNLNKQEIIQNLQRKNIDIIYIRLSYFIDRQISLYQQIYFFTNLSRYLEINLMLPHAINLMLQSESKNSNFKTLLNNIMFDLNKGKSFSSILEKNNFNKIAVALIRTSEYNANTKSIILQIIKYLNKKKTFSDNLTSSMIYPIIMIFLIIFFIKFIDYMLLNLILSLFDLNTIPLITKILVKIVGLINNIHYIFFIFILQSFLNYKFNTFRKFFDKIKIYIPIYSTFIIKQDTFNFIYTLSTLIKEEIKVVEAVNLSTQIINNLYIKEKFDKIEQKIKNGQSISSSIADNIFIDNTIRNILYTGDKTSSLKSCLEHSAIYIENQLNMYQKIFLKTLEPTITIFLGLTIIFIFISILLPVYNLFENYEFLL